MPILPQVPCMARYTTAPLQAVHNWPLLPVCEYIKYIFEGKNKTGNINRSMNTQQHVCMYENTYVCMKTQQSIFS